MIYVKKSKIWLALTIVFFIVFNTISIESLYAEATSNPYNNNKLTFYELQKLYHTRINDLFNAKTKLLEKGEKGPGTGVIPQGDECEEKNYSTFCLATTAAKEYQNYEIALESRKSKIEFTGENISVTLEKATTTAISQAAEINNELVAAKRALDTSVKTYNELSVAYTMHLQYEEVIKSLTKYKNKLSEYYEQVGTYPNKFVDATSLSCL
ncbi:hypothetical protein ACFL3C_03360 [Patescibacteria group bacterium]